MTVEGVAGMAGPGVQGDYNMIAAGHETGEYEQRKRSRLVRRVEAWASVLNVVYTRRVYSVR